VPNVLVIEEAHVMRFSCSYVYRWITVTVWALYCVSHPGFTSSEFASVTEFLQLSCTERTRGKLCTQMEEVVEVY
jgi:hypothetical protein